MSENIPSPIEDGRSQVAGARGRELSLGTKLSIVTLIGTVALGFVWFNAFYNHKSKQARNTPAAYTGAGELYNPPPPAATAPAPALLPASMPAPAINSTPAAQQQSPASAPIMAYSGSQNIATPATPATSSQPVPGASGTSNPSQSLGPDNSPLAARLKPTLLEGEQASVLKNPDMVITEGTMIPCVLQTAIDSQLPGLVTCVVPIDIRGTTGNIVLLDRGTRIVGQIESGLLQGQNRVFVDWTRAETPDHVIVTLDSRARMNWVVRDFPVLSTTISGTGSAVRSC